MNTLAQLFVFVEPDGHIASLCENPACAADEEAYLESRGRLKKVVSYIAPTYAQAWEAFLTRKPKQD